MRDRHCGVIGERPQPLPALIVGGRSPEYGQDAEHLTPEYQRPAGESSQTFTIRPLGLSKPRPVLSEILYSDWLARARDVAYLERTVRVDLVKPLYVAKKACISLTQPLPRNSDGGALLAEEATKAVPRSP